MAKTHLTLVGRDTDEQAMEAVCAIRELEQIAQDSNRLAQRAVRIAQMSTAEIQELQATIQNHLLEAKKNTAPGHYPEAA